MAAARRAPPGQPAVRLPGALPRGYLRQSRRAGLSRKCQELRGGRLLFFFAHSAESPRRPILGSGCKADEACWMTHDDANASAAAAALIPLSGQGASPYKSDSGAPRFFFFSLGGSLHVPASFDSCQHPSSVPHWAHSVSETALAEEASSAFCGTGGPHLTLDAVPVQPLCVAHTNRHLHAPSGRPVPVRDGTA